MTDDAFGYIKISRKQFDGNDMLWDDSEPYDRRSAWTWLLQSAAWQDSEYRVVSFTEPLKRGEFIASLRYLGIRWKWGKTRVADFLAQLKKAGRITGQRKGQHGTVYLIVNYDAYQTADGKSGTPRRTPKRTATGTPSGHLADKVEGRVRKDKELPTGDSGYSPGFDFLWKARPRRAGPDNKQAAFRAYHARLKEGCDYDAMFEGVKRYRSHLQSTGKEGTEYVKMTATFLGPDRHFEDEWPATVPILKPLEAAAKVWAGFKRTKILFISNRAEAEAAVDDMVQHGEVESLEWFRQLLRAVNRTQLQNAQNDHFAIAHIAEVMPPQLKLA